MKCHRFCFVFFLFFNILFSFPFQAKTKQKKQQKKKEKKKENDLQSQDSDGSKCANDFSDKNLKERINEICRYFSCALIFVLSEWRPSKQQYY